MNLVQLRLLKAKGYEYDGVKAGRTALGKRQYVAVAIKPGYQPAQAGGPTIPEAESRLVMAITRPGDDSNVKRWREEDRFLRRMLKRAPKRR